MTDHRCAVPRAGQARTGTTITCKTCGRSWKLGYDDENDYGWHLTDPERGPAEVRAAFSWRYNPVVNGLVRNASRARGYLLVVYTAARGRPLIVGVSVSRAVVHAVTADDHPIVLGNEVRIDHSEIRSRLYISGRHVTITSNVIDLREEP